MSVAYITSSAVFVASLIKAGQIDRWLGSTHASPIGHQWLHLIRLRIVALCRVNGRRMICACSCRYFCLWAGAAATDIVVNVVGLYTFNWRLRLCRHRAALASSARWLRTDRQLVTKVVRHRRPTVVLDVCQLKPHDLDTVGIKVTYDASVRRNELRVTERRADDIRVDVECTFSASVNLDAFPHTTLQHVSYESNTNTYLDSYTDWQSVLVYTRCITGQIKLT